MVAEAWGSPPPSPVKVENDVEAKVTHDELSVMRNLWTGKTCEYLI
jgi:hypothetical protein